MTDFVKKVQNVQRNGCVICPRCGRMSMKLPIHINALSRHAECYVCDDCGMDEALRDFARLPLAESEWSLYGLFSTDSK